MLLGVVVFSPPAVLPAADDLNATALALVPEDAAFMSTSVNLGDQWREIADSRLIRRIRSVPYVQQVAVLLRAQWEAGEGQVGQARAMLQNPNVQGVVKLLTEMMGDEMFIYGDQDWCGAIEGLVQFQRRVNATMSQGPEAMESLLQELTPADVANLYVPTTVIGFRIQDDNHARNQLDALEGILRLGLRDVPQAQPFLDQLKRTDFADGQSLALKLDWSMVPAADLGDEQRAAFERARELLSDRQLTIEVGMKSKVLMVAVSGRSGVIAEMGSAPKKLIDHPALDVLKQAAPDRLRGISFASEEMSEATWMANASSYFQNIAAQFSGAAMKEFDSEEEFEEWESQIERDATWLDQKVLEMKPDFGPVVGWTHAIDGGYQSFVYNFTKDHWLKNAAPLHVLNHAGQNPVALLAVKYQYPRQFRQIIDYLLEKAPEHIGRFVRLAERDPDSRRQAVKAVRLGAPVIKDAIEVCLDKLAPAMGSNETMLVFDADWLISDFGPSAPPLPKPLPVPEVAVVCSVADRAGFQTAMDELFDVLDRLVDVVREVDPSAVPAGYTIPRPTAEEVGRATRYSYPQIAQSVPLPGFNPQYSLGQDVVAFGYSDRQIRELVEEQKLVNRPAWLTPDFPLAGMCYADWAEKVRVFRAWVETGLMFASGGELDRPLGPATGGFPTPTGNDVLQLWDSLTALGKFAATTQVQDDGSTVSRSVWLGE
ncbi:MAG: hypothetical protein D6753_13215 [Planctomycetota bacterium]|nr:MAG: hypothetical protein D6753_13215 [Planctomycetota bacterium]